MIGQSFAKDKYELAKEIGAGAPHLQERGPVVSVINIWTCQTVVGSWYPDEGPTCKQPDAITNLDHFRDHAKLLPFVERLLETGQSFVAQTGDDGQVCTLEWTITYKPQPE